MTSSTNESRIRGAGLRVTAPRLAVLDAVMQAPHRDAEAIRRSLGDAHPALSVQSVHNVLHDLSEAGILRRIEPERSAALYEARVDDNHHHVVCRSCGAVADVDCVEGEAPCLHPADAAGFVIEQADVVFWGRCPACARQS
ncbi:Fur family transcriptional regulator [Homoserinibacter sp. YIM 151385]|uniref:Fur family transcriptional regulator n=1 Tax=Homoserinibacter sp. YIM 151385 TaxID=2985506 RepID=UPI0022F0DA8A|nr:Fur family transcriptional regulator [Homoserinibacter sp. YIM 151385]WBU36829.1 Fur family transcriptional regulator [Homoserinibacter sp. YIM 151385]